MRHLQDHDELTEVEASAGIKSHGVRYVLAFSLILAGGLLSLMWIYAALAN